MTETPATPPPALDTFFAPARRADSETIQRQAATLRRAPLLTDLYDCIQEMVVILNGERQIVFANHRFLDFRGDIDLDTLYGLRPGEAVGCVHARADYTPSGCGTSEFCKTCGAVRAILASQRGGAETRECNILRAGGLEALNLRVRATPIELEGEPFTVFAIEDVSHEKRREELERVFFHDILNTAGAVKGIADVLDYAPPEQQGDFRQRIRMGAARLIDEINSHRLIAAAERDELVCDWGPVGALPSLRDVCALFTGHASARGRELVIDPASADVDLDTDHGLLSRVLVNMVRNALEATPTGGTVTARCRPEGDSVRFEVHNPTAMPRDVALQIFQRSFSTKGRGRGLGTYSMRLIGERYLGGRVGFVSEPETGTTFVAVIPRRGGPRR